jgi:hypothetical protein
MVAAFIASLHFSSRWMDSIAELPEAGPLFIPLLRFAILEVASHDDDALLGTCLLGLMETNHRLGLDVIQWLQTYHPEIHERGLSVADA